MSKIIVYLKPMFKRKITYLTIILLGILMSLTVVLESYYETSYNAYYGEIKENMYYNTYWIFKENSKKCHFRNLKIKFVKNLQK